jgi:zinc protease
MNKLLPITRLQLDNGLQILLKEIRSAPLISHWVWYRVGSRDEVPGHTGISHWTEHMQFRGTQRFPGGILDRAIARDGGHWNAFTFLDWTTYFEVTPADKIGLALDLEADRMTGSLFRPEDVEAERTVIISERQGNENDPLFLLTEEVQAAAFRVHPYHHEIIGDMADLHSIQREDLYAHYRAFYTPNNAVLAIAGDFDTESMLAQIRERYEAIPSGAPPARLARPEPPQKGERRIIVEGPGETGFVEIAYRAPNATHPDFMAFSVLDSLLAGPTNLNIFGSGISNKTSRLYQALIEGEIAVGVSGGMPATIDPYLYSLSITMRPDRTPEEAIGKMDEEIARIQETAPSSEEVMRAVKQARALFAYGSESISNQAYWLGFSEMFADYAWFETYLERLAQVTPNDVQAAAQNYLRPQHRTVGVYHPTGPGGEGELETLDESEDAV